MRVYTFPGFYFFFAGFIESKSDLKWIKEEIFRSDDSWHFYPMYSHSIAKYYSVKCTPFISLNIRLILLDILHLNVFIQIHRY